MKIIKSQMENESFSFYKRKINVNNDWSVKRLSDHILSIKNGIYGDPIEKNSTSDIVNVFTLNCFSNNKKEAIVQRVIKSSSLNGRILESGDIVIERSGGGNNFEVGRSFVFKKENDLIHTAVDFTRIIKLKECVSPEYIQLLLSYFNKNGIMTKFAQKTTKISNLSKEFFDLKFPMPNDILMQYKIAKVLSQQEEQVNKIKTIIEKLEKRNQYYAERLLSGEFLINNENLNINKNNNFKKISLKYNCIKERRKIQKEYDKIKTKDNIIYSEQFISFLNYEKKKIEKILKKEQKRFDWISDALLSGEYQIVE